MQYRLLGQKAGIVWRVILGLALALVAGLSPTAAAQSLIEVAATEFFSDCPGVIVLEESTRIMGDASIGGNCTVDVASGLTLLLEDTRVTILGDLIIEGEAASVTIRQSLVQTEGALFVTSNQDITVRNSRFISADVSFDAAGQTAISRSNFEQVAGAVALMGGDSCQISYIVPDTIHCSIDPTPQCPCFEASDIVQEVDHFLSAFNHALITQCQSPSIQAAAADSDATLVISTAGPPDSVTMCSVLSAGYELQALPIDPDLNLTEEELGACQLAIEQACAELLR